MEPETRKWVIYMLRCGDGSLYTGITSDLARRLEEHQSGGVRCAKALRGRRPLDLVWSTAVDDKGRALSLEMKIKTLKKENKELLAGGKIGIEEIE